MLGAVAYVQDLNPLGNRLFSTVIAAMPVIVLFYLLVVRRWLASWAGLAGSITAIVIAWTIYGMPLKMASWSFVHGAVFGLLPIGWTVFNAMMIYNLTVVTGNFAIIRRSVAGLSADARCQAVLIGFAFGAFMEGAAGAGSPVAICGAMLVGLGFQPFKAAVICLIANTSPVAFGGLAVPILTLGNVTDIPAETLSVMAGHQLPLMSCLVPAYMIVVLAGFRKTLEVWPVLLVAGGSFGIFQYVCATIHTYVPGLVLFQMTDICGGIFSLLITAAFLKFFWQPRQIWHFDPAAIPAPSTPPTSRPPADSAHAAEAALLDLPQTPDLKADDPPLTAGQVIRAWAPFAIMSVCLIGSGFIRQIESTQGKVTLFGVQSRYVEPVPTLHLEVERAAQLQKPGLAEPEREKAEFNFAWVTAPGTPVLLATLISIPILGASFGQMREVMSRTVRQMKVPIPTIAFMLGLSYVTKYAGLDATLGIAFAETGSLYPFFAAMLGWLGVFLTGTDAGSNALFGSLQKITATQIHATGVVTQLSLEQTQILICTANSTGGVMGKMIDAQSICVATAGTNQIGREADIFKAVIWHSVVLAAVIGLLTLLQAYVYPFVLMVPHL
ncbi:L-lactate permease [Tuwongella immobilis]|uniref:L-lactate permease n=1 Tax=Tuwongella immobilis TaxID=692036 RepID=A0A6C2YIC2_9BACT|nr:L-lactate permease [Tuwongella immobilis]VIP01021.1 l-lactate transport : Lactate transporter, LctP family OS=uncultured planctomycete GN=HGMM_F37F03C19 PE=4 SV=1: Lactate_perm [Tuwongella immobilis]VTR97467.1 l-lactate transport : Lactate transporter, LctP family OS=uncultured planctomycete GN=HGMM_F37F03C19 PE=4 SV=1: Lactate_perm [Tuwongella immobilis]